MLLRGEKKTAGKAFCVALGGIITALVVLLMFCATMFPMLDYAIPAYAGFLMVIVIEEAGSKWALLTYCACRALSAHDARLSGKSSVHTVYGVLSDTLCVS